jgi:hypothetical protein
LKKKESGVIFINKRGSVYKGERGLGIPSEQTGKRKVPVRQVKRTTARAICSLNAALGAPTPLTRRAAALSNQKPQP